MNIVYAAILADDAWRHDAADICNCIPITQEFTTMSWPPSLADLPLIIFLVMAILFNTPSGG